VLKAARPRFLVASIAPVLVGSSLGYAVSGTFEPTLFVLALLAMMLLHAGANLANDYFDHVSGNDWVNNNPTPFSGGSRFIQNGLLSPKAVLLEALAALSFGSALGLTILLIRPSIYVLILGVVGLLGGFFYSAGPIRFGYRTTGESAIFLLFGVLPVCGSYYLQTGSFDWIALVPGSIVGILIFLVILVNEFPDAQADAQVNKRTLVVAFGMNTAAWIYRIALVASFVLSIVSALIWRTMLVAGLLYLLALPPAIVLLRLVNQPQLARPGQDKANRITILTHAIGSLALSLGFLATELLATAG